MPPKPNTRRVSISVRDTPTTASNKNAAMPPPPDPAPPQGLLEPEMNALSTCLRNAVVKTGQVYGFYADVRKHGIHQYASHPPRPLTASLGREIEKYDQLCDAMETHIQRAIAVLQRDLQREEERLRAEAAAAALAKDPTPILDSSTLTGSPTPMSPTQSSLSTGISGDTSGSQTPKPLPGPPRRQSTVSLSSLQRPSFPHKLDLSSAALRMNSDEILASGLSSPVTLAPKSSHRNIPQDLVMAALTDAAGRPVDIDLTVGDTEIDMEMQLAAEEAANAVSLDPALGSSADKPIELDLDMELDLFNSDANPDGQVDHFMNPSHGGPMGNGQMSHTASDLKPKVEEDMFMDALNAVGSDSTGNAVDIFSSLGATIHHPEGQGTSSSHLQARSNAPPKGAPSPASLLASFGAEASSSHPADGSTSQGGATFDLNAMDFTGLFTDHTVTSNSEIDNFFNMPSQDVSKDGKS